MFRLNAPNRTFAEVGDDVLPYCHVEGQAFGLPKPEALLNYRVVVSTCLDADILNKANLNNWSTMGMEAELRRKLHPRLFEEDRVLPHWTHLIIDEVSYDDQFYVQADCRPLKLPSLRLWFRSLLSSLMRSVTVPHCRTSRLCSAVIVISVRLLLGFVLRRLYADGSGTDHIFSGSKRWRT